MTSEDKVGRCYCFDNQNITNSFAVLGHCVGPKKVLYESLLNVEQIVGTESLHHVLYFSRTFIEVSPSILKDVSKLNLVEFFCQVQPSRKWKWQCWIWKTWYFATNIPSKFELEQFLSGRQSKFTNCNSFFGWNWFLFIWQPCISAFHFKSSFGE